MKKSKLKSAKIGLSRDIKFLLPNSVDKKVENFHLQFQAFFFFTIMLFFTLKIFHSSISSTKNKKSFICEQNLQSIIKTVYIIKKLDFNFVLFCIFYLYTQNLRFFFHQISIFCIYRGTKNKGRNQEMIHNFNFFIFVLNLSIFSNSSYIHQ